MSCLRSTPTNYKPRKGHTFHYSGEDDPDGHIYIILTNPFLIKDDEDYDDEKERVITVNFSHLDRDWRVCKIEKKEHCFIDEQTCIKYEHMKIWMAEKIQRHVMARRCLLYQNVDNGLLKRLICSATYSYQSPPDVLGYLNNTFTFDDYCGEDFEHLNR